MTMKKRVLGLALAAMVAVPATSAYANTITGPDTSPLTQNVKVSGSVKKSDGTAPEGKIEVELPTTLSFTVDQKGGLQGADYSVTNRSSVPVTVAIQSFSDTTPTDGQGITVKPQNEINDQKNRSYVSLRLVGTPVIGGGQTEVDLASLNASSDDDILQVATGQTGVMSLQGIAGTQEDTNGIDASGVTDEFNLVFNIRANK